MSRNSGQDRSAIEILRTTGEKHRPKDGRPGFIHWLNAVKQYTGFSKTALLDIACDAANISVNTIRANNPEYDPLARQAIIDTNPGFDFSNPPSGEQMQGALNAAKGKYFEYLVVERLNEGGRVGDIVLPPGYKAFIADSMNQPGWDIRIADPSGQTAEYLQLKATDSLSYVKDAIERYPDIRIMATNEVADSATGNDIVLDSDLSDNWLSENVQQAMLEDDSIVDLFVESFSPIISLAIVAGTEGMQVLVSRKSINDALASVMTRSGKSLTSQAVAAAVYACGGGFLSVPAGMFTRMVIERLHDLNVASEVIIRSRLEMLQLRLFQQEQLLLR
jgi:hypothetical protein